MDRDQDLSGGWIKLYRKIEDHQFWHSEPFSRGQAWVDLLLLANHSDNHFIKRGIRIEVKRGQVGMSALGLSKRWKWSRSKVTRFLKYLKNEHQIEIHKTNVTQIVTILNYRIYQANEHQTNTKRTPNEHQTNTNKNEKKEKKERERPKNLPYVEARLKPIREDVNNPPLFSDDADLFNAVSEKVRNDRAWWIGLKEYCQILHIPREALNVSIKKWAAHVLLKKPEDLRSWAKIEMSLKYWLMNEGKKKAL